MNKEVKYEKSYTSKEGYLTSHFNMTMVLDESDDKLYDVVDMVYDYLDTLGVDTLIETSKEDALKGFINFAKAHYTEYETNESWERVNK